MQHIFKGLFLVSMIGLTGCASLPQQPKTFDQLGQYQEIALNESTYRISFKANNNLSQGNAEEIALLKSAQITILKGFDSFKVLDDPSNRINQQQSRQTVVYPSRPVYPYYGRRGYYYHPFWNDPFYDMPYVVNVDPIEVSYTIQMFKTKYAPGDAFEAKRILQSLGSKYGLRSDGIVIVPQPQTVNKTTN